MFPCTSTAVGTTLAEVMYINNKIEPKDSFANPKNMAKDLVPESVPTNTSFPVVLILRKVSQGRQEIISWTRFPKYIWASYKQDLTCGKEIEIKF